MRRSALLRVSGERLGKKLGVGPLKGILLGSFCPNLLEEVF